MVAYIVKKGDTLYKIAQRYDVPLDKVIRANPQIPNPNLIYPGQIVYIPIEKKHKMYPKEPKCLIPYLPQVLNLYYMTQISNVYPPMPYYSPHCKGCYPYPVPQGQPITDVPYMAPQMYMNDGMYRNEYSDSLSD